MPHRGKVLSQFLYSPARFQSDIHLAQMLDSIFLKVALQDLQSTHNDSQGVLDLMGHVYRQGADGGQLGIVGDATLKGLQLSQSILETGIGPGQSGEGEIDDGHGYE